ncbi:penicillin-binding transpeptidase domain-containing protein [Leucobacter coleopterorum]|uniref:penicillin-binding transpeptidase domain-containing protein n=1 Tax=Leucobacter coleopterorum TaxID=2714933 RepID=UPI001FCBFCB1|nr:penicillin-binding transpeptidase domain-containing protein [Leucobacter coleopterorum]
MLAHGKITQADYDAAIGTEVVPSITERPVGCDIAEARRNLGYFCDYVQRYILNDPNFGDSTKERQFNFQRGGFDIYTSIDLDLQESGINAMRANVPAVMDGIDIGSAAVSVEPGTGRVLTMIQNRFFTADPEVAKLGNEYTGINYNTDFEYGGSGGFQVGSTFKAITLAEWLRSGRSVKEIVNTNGRTEQFQNFSARCLDEGIYGYGNWTFQNDQGRQAGSQTVEYAMEQSLNGGLVSMQQQLDLCDTFDTAQKLGLHRATEQNFNESQNNYGTRDLAILPSTIYAGTDEIAPITMAAAFAAFANGGKLCTPVPIDAIKSPDGKDVPFTRSKCSQAVSPEVAAGVTYVLQNAVNRGVASHARSSSGVPHFAKTGTTDDVKDNWTIGGSSKVTTAVWVGNVTGNVSTMNFGGWGGLMAADQSIWPAIMNAADQKYGGDPFAEPSSVALRVVAQDVPDTTGQDVASATKLLKAAGFTVEDGGETDSLLAEGLVTETSPAAGTSAPAGSAVKIFRSGATLATVPDVVGEFGKKAASRLRDAGFVDISVPKECAAEKVSAVTPVPGTSTRKSDTVTLACR